MATEVQVSCVNTQQKSEPDYLSGGIFGGPLLLRFCGLLSFCLQIFSQTLPLLL